MLYWSPDLVHLDRVEYDSEELLNMMREDPDAYQDVQKLVNSEFVGPRVKQKDAVQVGVMGYPEEVSAEIGEKMAQDSVAKIVEAIRQIESQR